MNQINIFETFITTASCSRTPDSPVELSPYVYSIEFVAEPHYSAFSENICETILARLVPGIEFCGARELLFGVGMGSSNKLTMPEQERIKEIQTFFSSLMVNTSFYSGFSTSSPY